MSNTIANTIAQQIGNAALSMIGARDLVATESGLQLAIGRNPKGVSKLVVDLAADDTYTVSAYKGRGLTIRLVGSTEMVYADSLRATIEQVTGLLTTL